LIRKIENVIWKGRRAAVDLGEGAVIFDTEGTEISEKGQSAELKPGLYKGYPEKPGAAA
jgi:hypothetical protein